MRFGLQLTKKTSAGELREVARAAEAAGFDVLHTADHVEDYWAPLMALQAVADATTTLRVCPLVINNDLYHPVQLAREVIALDHLSGGRVELGIGAGHSFPEYAAIGLPFDPPAVRKARLGESVEILRQLLAGGAATFAGEHYQVVDVHIMAPLQERIPILVGVNGPAALAHAARHADIVAPTMLGRLALDGRNFEVRWEADRLDRTIDHIRTAAAAAGRPMPRLHALVQAVEITDYRQAAAEEWAAKLGCTVDTALTTPFLALGTPDEIAAHLLECQRRWSYDYFTVRDVEVFAPVIARINGLTG